jgi:hypothetical protein
MARYDFSSIRPSKPTYPKSTSAILLAGKGVERKRETKRTTINSL